MSDQPTCMSCLRSGHDVYFPLTPKCGAPFGSICSVCDDNSPWSIKPLTCFDCEFPLTDESVWGNRKYGLPRCEDCHLEYRKETV